MSKYKPQIVNLQKLASPTYKPINVNPYEEQKVKYKYVKNEKKRDDDKDYYYKENTFDLSDAEIDDIFG